MIKKEIETAHEIAFDAFCKTIIRNACMDGHRKKRVYNKYEIHTTSGELEELIGSYEDIYSGSGIIVSFGNVFVEFQNPILAEALGQLTRNQRLLIYKRFFLGMEEEEIAALQNIKADSVKRTMFNVLKRLRKTLEVLGYEEK